MVAPSPWLQAELTEADVRGVLRRTVWMTVPEIAKHLHVTRHVYRVQIANLLRRAARSGTVDGRPRSRLGVGRGRGPTEYRRVA